MSTRHREGRPVGPAREMRRADRRRVRHHADQALHVGFDDADALTVADVRHTRPPAPRAAPDRRRRHWKEKAWKRRTTQRHERNAAIAALSAGA